MSFIESDPGVRRADDRRTRVEVRKSKHGTYYVALYEKEYAEALAALILAEIGRGVRR
jgi:hypothetical protein